MKLNDYPRVLVIALGRINERDTYNNGLLLRNLFGKEWPRERLAQIYSSGDTGDQGFFGRYYKLGPSDRYLGCIFYRLKSDASSNQSIELNGPITPSSQHLLNPSGWLKQQVVRLLVDTGLYELIFRPRLSNELMNFVSEFQPDVIFAQGYNLTFSWLPLMLKRATGARLAVLTTDDWPKYLYAGMHSEPTAFRCLVRPIVTRAAHELFTNADIPFAFGEPMAQEYARRYGKPFLSINHADDPARFESCTPRVIGDGDVKTIVAIGTFNHFRWPLLLDADAACSELNRAGSPVRIAVLSSSVEKEGRQALEKAKFVDLLPDPGNDELPCYLKAADALLLLEGFDEAFVSAIKLSVSSKAHLFMFSKRPVVVYAAAETGIAKYAINQGWAEVVSNRSIGDLTAKLRKVLIDRTAADQLVRRAYEVASEYHTHATNQVRLLNALSKHSKE